MALIYLIEDDQLQREMTAAFLSGAGHEVRAMKDACNAMAEIRLIRPDAVITDIMHPGITGGDLYVKIREEIGTDMPVMITSSSHLHIARLPKVKDDPLFAFCPKPIDSARLIHQLTRLLERRGVRMTAMDPEI